MPSMLCEVIGAKVILQMIRNYTELSKLQTFEERFNYLKLNGIVGKETFGYDRYLNQILYQRPEWKSVRNKVIIRDNGCDLGIIGREIQNRIIIHHMNPITVEDIKSRNPIVFDPEYLISTVHRTHNAIHYSDEDLLPKNPIERKPNDTCPWKR